jgi:drug/metabolite transporter (DMT)-like permease
MSVRAWTCFALVSTLWGIPYLFIKVAVDDGVPPGFLAWSRVTLGALVLLALAWRAGTLRSVRGRWRWLLMYAVFEIVIPFPLIPAGEQRISSSLAAILIATVPLIVALLALRFDHAERATGRRLVGLIVGLAGVVALVGIDVAGRPDEMLGAAAIGVAAFGYAVAPMVLKRHMADLDPRATMAVSLALASLLLAPAAAIAPPATTPSGGGLLAIIVLGLFCTAAALVHGHAGGRGRPRPRAGHHVRQPGGRGRARRHHSRRERRARSGGRPAAHPRRLVALHRRPPAAGPHGGVHPPAPARPDLRGRKPRLAANARCGARTAAPC